MLNKNIQSKVSTVAADINTLLITDKCIERMKATCDAGSYLRVLVEGGGCSGFQYKFEISAETAEDDIAVERQGTQLLVDPDSFELLKGATIDYEEELIRSGFKILKNPKAEKGCSCGVSFALKMD